MKQRKITAEEKIAKNEFCFAKIKITPPYRLSFLKPNVRRTDLIF